MKSGLMKTPSTYWSEEEAKLIKLFWEDISTVRAKWVEYFIEAGKYERNQYWVLILVEGRKGTIELVPDTQKEENKTPQIEAEEAKLIRFFKEDEMEVRSKWVERFIENWPYFRNQYWVLQISEELEEASGTIAQPAPQKAEVEVLDTETKEETTEITQETDDIVLIEDLTIEEVREIYEEKVGEAPSDYYKGSIKRMINKIESVQ